MLDYKLLSKEVSETIRSFTADELQEWLNMDRKRMALAEMEDGSSQMMAKPCRTAVKLDGASQNVPKPHKLSVRQKKEIVD